MLVVPEEKRLVALNWVQKFKNKRKSTIKDLQRLSGLLNFLNKAIVPGRTFTRRMYAKYSGKNFMTKKGVPLRQYHHVKLDEEFRNDCRMWESFLLYQDAINRPFMDLSLSQTLHEISLYSDASANPRLGMGAIFRGKYWIFVKWEEGFIEKERPSIDFLKLYALCMGVFTWSKFITQTRVTIFCDNMPVKFMVNNMAGKCKNTMMLLRLLALDNMRRDRRVFVEHIEGKQNNLSDALSRLQFDRFFDQAPNDVNEYPERLPEELWPLSKIWLKE